MTANNDSKGDQSSYTVPLLINGKDLDTKSTFDVEGPSTEKIIWKAQSASADDAKAAVEAAQAAFPKWSQTSPSQRRDIFLKAAELMQERSAELSDYMIQETGAAAPFTGFNVSTTVEMLKDIAGRIAGAVVGSTPWCADPNTSAMVIKEPYGVVLAIAPWNAPYILGMRSVAYPLAAGNTCVFKGSELSPRVFYAIGALFRDAGLPDGVLNVIYHRPSDAAEVTTTLIEHPSVRKINFTGSTPVGRIIAQTAAKHLKPVLLELGGKAPAIVLADADLDKTAQACAVGAFFHSGQICMSTERVIVHESIVDKFSELLKKAVDHMFDPKADAPVLITAAGVKKTRKLVDDALAAGAKAIGGKPPSDETTSTRMRPIIISDVTKEMDVFYAETFGPHVTLSTFRTEDEAIAMANDTEYGLSASVFTGDLAAGLRIARRVESGAVHVNSMTVHDEPRLPHGGVKMSGYGRFGAGNGLEEFLVTKTITFPK